MLSLSKDEMLISYRIRLRLNATQRADLERLRVLSCDLYNAALQERRDAWRLNRKNISCFEQYRELTELRQGDPEYAAVSAEIMREPLRRVNRAFEGFFRRCKAGQKPGFPRFRSRDRYSSIAWPTVRINGDRLLIPSGGSVRFKTSRPILGEPKTATLIRKSEKKWIAQIVCDIGPAPAKVAVSIAVGIDVGLSALATLSDGTIIENPRWTKRHEERIAGAHQLLSRKVRGSKNRQRARATLRCAYQRASDARDNYLHHVSKWLVNQYDLIAYEKLQINNMVRGNLAKSIMDAAWGKLLFQVSYKAESAGRYAIAVNPMGTSQRCSGCGETVKKTLADREHVCPHCGLTLGRDHNAAINILRLGESLAGIVPSERLLVGGL
jgi:putative transposase